MLNKWTENQEEKVANPMSSDNRQCMIDSRRICHRINKLFTRNYWRNLYRSLLISTAI